MFFTCTTASIVLLAAKVKSGSVDLPRFLCTVLLIENSEIDFFIDSLDQTLALGLGNLFKNFIVNNVRELI